MYGYYGMGCGRLFLGEASYESFPDNRDEERMMRWECRSV